MPKTGSIWFRTRQAACVPHTTHPLPVLFGAPRSAAWPRRNQFFSADLATRGALGFHHECLTFLAWSETMCGAFASLPHLTSGAFLPSCLQFRRVESTTRTGQLSLVLIQSF